VQAKPIKGRQPKAAEGEGGRGSRVMVTHLFDPNTLKPSKGPFV